MSGHVKAAEFRGVKALSLESNKLRVIILPEQGGRIASIKYLPSGKEFLVQGQTELFKKIDYDADYLTGENAGFDDMFPTISEYHYENYPWKGIRIPDHGEVCTLKWDYTVGEKEATLTVHGIRLPYILTKKLIILDEDTLNIAYTATNPTDFDMDFLWAAHIMTKADKGCKHIPPKSAIRAVCTYSESGKIGGYMDEFDFPYCDKSGETYDASVYRGDDADDFQKFYFKDKFKQGEYALDYPDGHRFKVEFPVGTVPYFSGLNAEGGSLNLRSVYFEPCTAPYDRPDVARLHGKNSTLKARSDYKWYLNIKVNRKEV